MLLISSILVTLVASVSAAPLAAANSSTTPEQHDSTDNYTRDIQIHESCSEAQSSYLRAGLVEMNLLASHAHERILRLGEYDPLYVRYFGIGSSAAASGYYAQMVYGNKAGVLLRCDDPDGNCGETTQAGPWAGHHRGLNGTSETVICPPTYNTNIRTSLRDLCWDGNLIGSIDGVQYLGADLMHRMTHVPTVAFDHVVHAADDYEGVLQLAANNDSMTVFNSDTLQLFALDSYARDVVSPPSGCSLNE